MENSDVKREVVFNMESGLFLFLAILICGIVDVVFPDWFFFALYIKYIYVFTKRGRQKEVSIYVKKGKEGGKEGR